MSKKFLSIEEFSTFFYIKLSNLSAKQNVNEIILRLTKLEEENNALKLAIDGLKFKKKNYSKLLDRKINDEKLKHLIFSN